MIRTAATSLMQLFRAVVNYSISLFYAQWTHRYLLYLAACLLIGFWTYVALDIYGWLTWRNTSISFRGNYIMHTMINFGFCLYFTDEWLVHLTGKWGKFENRTLGKQALIWGISFVIAFSVQRTLVFEAIKYYSLDLYHYYEEFPQMRPRLIGNFLFCLPFFIGTILLLWLMAFVGQRELQKQQKALIQRKLKLDAKEKSLANQVSTAAIEHDTAPICILSGSSQIILDQDTISHISVEDHYCHIHTMEEDEVKSYFVKSSLTDLLEKLPDSQFIQIHRSHVVNARAIRQFDKKNRACKVHLKSNAVLPVSRHRLNEVMTQIQDVLELG